MKIVNVIKEYCNCDILTIKLSTSHESRIIYISSSPARFDLTKTLSTSITNGNSSLEVSYSTCGEMSDYNHKLMNDLLHCILEAQSSWELQNIISKFGNMSGTDMTLTSHLEQVLDTLVSSELFDKVAVLFYNEQKSELRGVHIASNVPYSNSDLMLFKMLRLPVPKNLLDDLSGDESIELPALEENLLNLEAEKVEKQIILPLKTGSKVYGMLVTYSPSARNDHQLATAKSTAHLIATMLSATIVYYKYKLAVTSEKQMSDKLREYEDMAFLGNNTASIAHEIKNPLIAIGGFAKRLMKAVSDPNLQKMAMVISSETERLERLTADILSYSKKHIPQKEFISLHEEMEAVKLLFATRSIEDDIKININIDNNLKVAVDCGQFRQVVVNLVANAMNAIEHSGTVSIYTIDDGDYIKIIIEDTGSGIKDEHLEHIFSPFFTTSTNGTGLGLAISKKIMINHGGDIFVNNTENGAMFVLVIPKVT